MRSVLAAAEAARAAAAAGFEQKTSLLEARHTVELARLNEEIVELQADRSRLQAQLDESHHHEACHHDDTQKQLLWVSEPGAGWRTPG